MAKNTSIIGTITPPKMIKCVPDVGGSTKFELTPGGGLPRGIVARMESGIDSREDIIGSRSGIAWSCGKRWMLSYDCSVVNEKCITAYEG